METVQERELLQLQLQGWPSFHAMPASFDAGSGYTYSGSSNSSVGGDGFLLGWEPPFGCFVAADAQLHDLFPLCTSQFSCSVLFSSADARRPAMT
jgi:hypothetical protein